MWRDLGLHGRNLWSLGSGPLGPLVAVKISHAKFNDRFERESQAISALNHPHICTLYDIGPN